MSEETFTANIGGCDSSDCASCSSNFSSAGKGSIPRVPNPTIKLTLEDNTVLECAVLTTFPVEDFGEFIALVPLDKDGKSTSGETYLFRYAEDEEGNPVVTNIEPVSYTHLHTHPTSYSIIFSPVCIREFT